MSGVFSAFLVAFKHLVPEHRLAILGGKLSIRVKVNKSKRITCYSFIVNRTCQEWQQQLVLLDSFYLKLLYFIIQLMWVGSLVGFIFVFSNIKMVSKVIKVKHLLFIHSFQNSYSKFIKYNLIKSNVYHQSSHHIYLKYCL